MSTKNIFQIFLMERSVLRDQFHGLLYDLVPLVTKRLDSSMFTGGFLCLFTAKQLKMEGGILLNLRSCPCNVILDELHPTYIRLINSSVAFAGDNYRVARHTSLVHYHSSVLCVGRWRRLPVPFMPSWLGCCRVRG